MKVSERRRVAVTGLGVVSSIGTGVAEFTAGLRAGRVGTAPIRSFDTAGFPATMAGEVPDFEPAALLQRLDPKRCGRSSQLAAAAARLAVTDSGVNPAVLSASGCGSIIGTTSGEATVVDELAAQWVGGGLAGLDRVLVRRLPASRIAAAVNLELDLTGDAQTLPTACSASNYALGIGYDRVSTGAADFALAGGADSVNRWTHAGFFRLGAMSPDVCRPFDADREGMITGEGGVCLLLEPLDAALDRGATVYAELLGYAVNCDADHMVHPDPASIADCVRAAHDNAGVRAEQVDYICAHGTGTPTNDATEVRAMRDVFGDTLPPVSSIKSMIGHTMGAASGFGAVACCAALHDGFLPPTANLRTVDPELGEGLDCVPGTARDAQPAVVQNNGFAFGGNNAVTVFGRVQ